MRSMKCIPIIAILALVSTSSTLEAQLLSRPAMRGRIVSRPAASPATYSGYNTGWYPYVIARGEDRLWIRETPIEQRPNRPMHFWGNSRRRAQTGPLFQPGVTVANGATPVTPVPVVIPTAPSIPTLTPTGLGSGVANPVVPTPVQAQPQSQAQSGFILREINR